MQRVAVLRGGPSSEYEVSMRTGRAVLEALASLDLPHKDIVITKQGEWLDAGIIKTPQTALTAVDVVFVALHGEYGEDGKVQQILNQAHLPFTGSDAFSSAIAFNKALTKQSLKEHGIQMPKHHRLNRDQYLDSRATIVEQLLSEIGAELVLKPVAGGSSLGLRYAPSSETLRAALAELFTSYEQLLIEEFIRGREATIGILDGFRGEPFYAFPAIEIVPPFGKPLFDHEDKYSGATYEVVPGRFSYHEKSLLADAARTVHTALGCRHYSRSDFIVRSGEIFFLEINTLPGLTNESLYPKAAAAIGLSFPQLVSHLLMQAVQK